MALELLGRPRQGDGTCRGGYGLPVVERCGTRCAYCDRDLADSYEAWLDLSVDHVVPGYLTKAAAYPVAWVEDLLNLVTCCRACNEFLNGFRVSERLPDDLTAFVDLVARVLDAKRRLVLERHKIEEARYQAWRRTLPG